MLLSRLLISILCNLLLIQSALGSAVAVTAAEKKDIVRYSVLILDASGSMSGTPMEKQKEAAEKFCEAVLKAKGVNKVAIVELASYGRELCQFTADIDKLKSIIRSLSAYSGTNTNDALEMADKLLLGVSSGKNIIKNIILCTDGIPEEGKSLSEGPYKDYYANAAYATAKKMKSRYSIYTLGFFHSLSDSYRRFAEKFMKDLQNRGYYDVEDPSNLDFSFGDIADDIGNNGAKDFVYDRGYTAQCYYRDSYFEDGSFNYNNSLATMSMCFAMSAFANENEPDYTKKSSNAVNMLKNIIGVKEEQIEVNEGYRAKPTTDSIGAVVGNKKIRANGKDYTLIALAIRGGGYEQEWASNFTIGSDGDHGGFSTAKANVLNFLKEYIKRQKITGPVKLWITGHSRAGATANLLGAEINKLIVADSENVLCKGVECKLYDVYIYCFEVPRGANMDAKGKEAVYNNIFNIINPYDPVPMVAPEVFKFFRYGKDRTLPTRSIPTTDYSKKRNKMLDIYKEMEAYKKRGGDKIYLIDKFQMKKFKWEFGVFPSIKDDIDNNIAQDIYLNKYVKMISNKIFLKARGVYFHNYQTDIREICKVYFGKSGYQQDKFVETFMEKVEGNKLYFLVDYKAFWKDKEDLYRRTVNTLKESLDEAGIPYDVKDVEKAGRNLAKLLINIFKENADYLATAMNNAKSFAAAHYPELCYAWLASADSNYTSNPQDIFSTGLFRKIRINCPVDIEVKNERGEVVASIMNEMPVDLGEEGLVAGIDGNAEKFVIVPADETYNIKITGREDSTVNYGIDEEYILGESSARVLNYFDISLKKGQSITGVLPAYSDADIENAKDEGSNAGYILNDPENRPIQVSSELRGEQAENASYIVDVESADRNAGFALGGGVFNYGSFAKVSAYEQEGYAFKGWYDDKDKLVSGDKEYRFCVKADTKLTAKFDKKNTGTVETVPMSNGNVAKGNVEKKEENKPKDIAKLNITLEKAKYVYDGEAKEPVVTVKAEEVMLEEGKQYKVEYANNENVGIATVTISGTGEYTGKVLKKFTILPKGNKLTKTTLTKKGLKLNWKKQTEQTDGYQIQYSTESKFTKGFTKIKLINKNKSASYSITKLKNGKYYIRIRTYKVVDGKKYYSSWSKVKVVKVKPIK